MDTTTNTPCPGSSAAPSGAASGTANQRIQLLEGPTEAYPMGAPAGGLYMKLLGADGPLSSAEIYDYCAQGARELGFDPDGRSTVGPPRQHGVKSCTHAVWFHDKLKP